MAVVVRDEHLENLIDTERQRRGDATQAKTLSDLARERLMQLEIERRTYPNKSMGEDPSDPSAGVGTTVKA